MRCKNFLKVHKNTGEKMFTKYLSADGCFVKTIIPLTVMMTTMLSVSLRLVLLGNPWNEISPKVLERSICVAAGPF